MKSKRYTDHIQHLYK